MTQIKAPCCGYPVAQHRLERPVPGQAERPEPGCLSICWGCGAVLEFTGAMTLRALTEAELEKIGEQDPQGIAIIRGVQKEIRVKNALKKRQKTRWN